MKYLKSHKSFSRRQWPILLNTKFCEYFDYERAVLVRVMIEETVTIEQDLK